MLFLVLFCAAPPSFVLTITLYLGMNRKLLCLKDLLLCRSGALMTHGLDFLLLSMFSLVS